MPIDPTVKHAPTADETWQSLRVSMGRTIPRDLRNATKAIRALQAIRRGR